MPLPRIAWYAVAPSLSNDKARIRQETIARIKWIHFIPERDFVTLSISLAMLTRTQVEAVNCIKDRTYVIFMYEYAS